ncbi:gll4353 [Gloeobacter violaceus PCC 7421]|uniref:Gll4353 protein n=2 Tax=Gloeobacter violaceus TaxID=33072 RepID=Q7ND83_GLOVI|nr:gll4353 [Gloeobacter violaceus PCC 7421]
MKAASVAACLVLLGSILGPGEVMPWPVRLGSALAAVWVLSVFLGFELRIGDGGLTRRLGPLVLHCRWTDLETVRVDAVPGFRRVRLVLHSRNGDKISFPLFLLGDRDRIRLADRLLHHLPDTLRQQWLNDGDSLLR